jgi:predicted nucleotidyltransferase
MHFDIVPHTIFLARHGSHAYGTNIEGSDLDLKGIAIPPREHVTGFAFEFEQLERHASKGHPHDEVIYDLRKFMKLAADCNPNIIEVLFCDQADVLTITPEAELLVAVRNLFISKKAKHTFSGYAISQLKRIRTHRKWLLEPPKAAPERKQFDLAPEQKITPDMMGAYDKLVQEGDVAVPENVMQLVQREKQYMAALAHWKQYLNWKETRNPARAELEAKHGYDCYLDDTEFLTFEGWRRYDEIPDALPLATVSQTTGHLEFHAAVERVSKAYTGPICFIETQDTACAVTPNHRMWVSEVRGGKSNKRGTKYTEARASWSIRTADEMINGHRYSFHARTATEGCARSWPASRDTLILIGAYVSEGSVAKKLVDGSPSVLCFSQKAGGRQEAYLEELMRGHPDSMRRYSAKRAEKWRKKPIVENTYTLADRVLAKQVVDQCGEGSHAVHLPSWAFALDKKNARLLLDVLMKGDGTDRKHSRVYYTASHRLAGDVQALAVVAGLTAKVWGPYDYEDQARCAMYQVYVGRDGMTRIKAHGEKSDITTQNVVGRRIVCFTVPNEILITRRNGKVAIQGNTKHAMHLVRLLRMCREILDGRGVIVKRPDREELLSIRFGKWSYDQLIEWADREDAGLSELYEKSTLPHAPPVEKLNQLCVAMHDAFWRRTT